MSSAPPLNAKVILAAAQRGNLSAIETLRANYPNVSWQQIRAPKTEDTIPHVAAREGHLHILNYIKDHWQWSPNITNSFGKTPLHEAAQFSHAECTKMLLVNGANANVLKQASWTPLMLACTRQGAEALKTVQLLTTHDTTTINTINKDGWTAGHIAARGGDLAIINHLLHANNNLLHRKTNNERAMLHIACLHGHLNVVQRILQDVDTVDITDSCGNTPLLDAVASETSSALPIMGMLLGRGADLGIRNAAGLSVLHVAAGHSTLKVVEHIVSVLKVDPNVLSTEGGLSPLHIAARGRRGDIVDLLIRYGAQIGLVDEFGRTPYFYLTL